MDKISLKENNLNLNEVLEAIKELPARTLTQEKTVNINQNGVFEVLPDSGKALSKVNVVANIQGNDIIDVISGEKNELNHTNIINIGIPAFQNATTLTSVNLQNCETICESAFYSCKNLKEINLPDCTSIGSDAFGYCSSLSYVNIPNCSQINERVFEYCTNLHTVSANNCTLINTYAFLGCNIKSNLYAQNCSKISSNAFYNCSIPNLELPNCSYFEKEAFRKASIWSLNLPQNFYPYFETHIFQDASIQYLTLGFRAIASYTFANASIGNLTLLNCQNIDSYAFQYTTLSNLSLPSCTTYIHDYGFADCSTLTHLTLNSPSVVRLGGPNAFNATPMKTSSYHNRYGSIYVPGYLLSLYKNETNWTLYSDRIVAIPGTEVASLNYRVENVNNSTYTFELKDDGYYESNNQKIANSTAICKAIITIPDNCNTLYLDCINYAESGYDYGMISYLDQEFNTFSVDNCKKSFKSQSSSTPLTISYEVSPGEHYIYIQYLKDSSQDSYNDSFKFKIYA